jgi:propionate CoA-transferase
MISLIPRSRRFFVDFSGCVVRHLKDVKWIRTSLLARVGPLGKKVPAIVNYEAFMVRLETLDACVAMALQVFPAYCSSVSRFATGAFLGARLARDFCQCGVVPHIFGSERDAGSPEIPAFGRQPPQQRREVV